MQQKRGSIDFFDKGARVIQKWGESGLLKNVDGPIGYPQRKKWKLTFE